MPLMSFIVSCFCFFCVGAFSPATKDTPQIVFDKQKEVDVRIVLRQTQNPWITALLNGTTPTIKFGHHQYMRTPLLPWGLSVRHVEIENTLRANFLPENKIEIIQDTLIYPLEALDYRYRIPESAFVGGNSQQGSPLLGTATQIHPGFFMGADFAWYEFDERVFFVGLATGQELVSLDHYDFLATLNPEVFLPLTSTNDCDMPIGAVTDEVLRRAITSLFRKGIDSEAKADWRVSVGVLASPDKVWFGICDGIE